MTAPAPMDLAVQRRRLMIMLIADAVCVLVAIGAVIGFLSFHIVWLGAVFVAAVLAGFAAQIWLVLGLRGKA